MTDISQTALPPIHSEDWGTLADGTTIHRYTLRNSAGLSVHLSDYGGRILRVQMPDRNGVMGDITLGHPDLDAYVHHPQARYFGAVIGRFGNRIAHGQFFVDDHAYTLTLNDGPNALHGGPGGFHARPWQGRPVQTPDGQALELTLHSPDGDEGYPGALDVTVRYTLSESGELRIDYTASSDAPTIVNLTNHAYWNLRDGGAGAVLGHELTLEADAYTPVDATLIPTGAEASVQGTPFDFTTPHTLGERIDADDEQLQRAQGYDHHFIARGSGLRRVATLTDPVTGRRMEVHSDQPGLQVYSGNFNDGTLSGYGGAVYGYRSSVCLETQHAPDSPNQAGFPSTVLRPGETFTSTTVYRFFVQ